MSQFVTRIDEDLAAQVDALVDDGTVASRSDAVRTALRRFVEENQRAKAAREMVEAYRRMPQTDGEMAWADEATVKMIAEEPW